MIPDIWTIEMNEQHCFPDGWGIFWHTDNEEYQLQKLNEAEIFDDDGDAWIFVWKEANWGTRLAGWRSTS